MYRYTTLSQGLDWTEQCFTSPPTQYRLYERRYLHVKRPNQQYQSTEGTYSTQTNQIYNNQTINTKHSKSPSLQQYGVTRGWLQQRAGSPCLNGGGTAAAVPPQRLTPTRMSMLRTFTKSEKTLYDRWTINHRAQWSAQYYVNWFNCMCHRVTSTVKAEWFRVLTLASRSVVLSISSSSRWPRSRTLSMFWVMTPFTSSTWDCSVVIWSPLPLPDSCEKRSCNTGDQWVDSQQHTGTNRLYSAIHIDSCWKIPDSWQIKITDNTQTKHNPEQEAKLSLG